MFIKRKISELEDESNQFQNNLEFFSNSSIENPLFKTEQGFKEISWQKAFEKINYEILKPANDIPFFVNAYGSMDGRFELNTHFNQKYSDKLSSTLFIHGNTRNAKNDMNDDGFLDGPIGKQVNILSRLI